MSRYFDVNQRLVTVEVKQTGEQSWKVFKTRVGKNGAVSAPQEVFCSPVPIHLELDGFNSPKIVVVKANETDKIKELAKCIFTYRQLEELMFEVPVTFKHLSRAFITYAYRQEYIKLQEVSNKPQNKKKVFCVLFGQPEVYLDTLCLAVREWMEKADTLLEDTLAERKRQYTKQIMERLNADSKEEDSETDSE
jgi:hypothetical protein